MTNLKCSVENCLYNADHLCSLNEIDVNGPDAHHSEATCCHSFRDGEGKVSNSEALANAKLETSIKCSAENCVYNEECHCYADDVDICGCGAKKTEHTECDTFRCR